jgi:PAS domain S-box-containing protein
MSDIAPPAIILPQTGGEERGTTATYLALPWRMLALCIAYYLGTLLGKVLIFPSSYISIIWPPNAVLLVALLLSPRWHWLWLLASALPVHLLAQAQSGTTIATASVYYGFNCVIVPLTAIALRRFGPRDLALRDLRQALSFVVVTAVATAVGSLVWSPLIVMLRGGGDVWNQWSLVFLSNFLPFIIATPGSIAGLRHGAGIIRKASIKQHAELVSLIACLLGSGVVVFGLGHRSLGHFPALFYIPLPFLLWAAVRFGPPGLSLSFLAFALMAIVGAIAGYGPFVALDPADTVERLQAFLLALYVPLLVLAAVVEERKGKEQALRRSEERYREVVESQKELVCRYLPDTTLTFVNEAYCRAFGKTREELIGMRYLTLIPEEQHAGALAVVHSAVHERRPMRGEHEVLMPNGSIGWMEWQDFPIVNDAGIVDELQGIGRDVTERKLAELALLESEARIQLTAKTLSLGFFVWNPFTERLWVSEKVGSLLGFAPSDTVSYEKFLHHVLPEDRARVESTVQRSLSQLVDFELEYRVRLPGGAVRWIDARARCLLDALGKFDQLTGIVMDVTAQKNAELRMRAQLEEMAHTSRLALVGELTASIAHEVNQPLGAILSNAEAAEMLLDAPDPPLDSVREILRDIRADDARASEVVRRLRTLLRKRELKMQPLDLNELLSETLHFVTFDAHRRSVEIVTDLAGALPNVHGDRLHLQQVLLNLLLNGMDAMAHTPVSRRRITVRSSPHVTGGVECLITDCGPGIAPDRLPRLFDSFFTTKADGVGLGLSIARSIVEAHRGEIWAENRADGGAAFHLVLGPAASCPMPASA